VHAQAAGEGGKLLWAHLRGRRFQGAKFRRQVPFDGYVADFYRHAAKLVIEIDGRQHEGLVDDDAGRTAVIENFGVRVRRFTNAENLRGSGRGARSQQVELRLSFG